MQACNRSTSCDPCSSDPASSWSTWLARERPGAAFGALVIIALLGATILYTTGSVGWTAFGAVVLLATQARFFLPARFSVDARGVTAGTLLATRRLEWNQVRRCGFDERGGFLGRRMRRTWLDGFTGLTLHFPATMPAAMRDAITRGVRARIDERTTALRGHSGAEAKAGTGSVST